MAYVNNKRWRRRHPVAWAEQKKRYYDQFCIKCRREGLPWSKAEWNLILGRDFSDREASILIGRSVRAIQVKRSKLRKLIERRLSSWDL